MCSHFLRCPLDADTNQSVFKGLLKHLFQYIRRMFNYALSHFYKSKDIKALKNARAHTRHTHACTHADQVLASIHLSLFSDLDPSEHVNDKTSSCHL